jgi:hypothetical protein
VLSICTLFETLEFYLKEGWNEHTRFQPSYHQKLQWDLAPEEEGITKQISLEEEKVSS